MTPEPVAPRRVLTALIAGSIPAGGSQQKALQIGNPASAAAVLTGAFWDLLKTSYGGRTAPYQALWREVPAPEGGRMGRLIKQR